MNYLGDLDLMKLKKVALVKGKAGQDVLMIDVAECELILSPDKKVCKFNFVGWDKANSFSSHMLKKQHSKETNDYLKTLTKEELNRQDPIFGNLKEMKAKGAPSATPKANNPLLDDVVPVDDIDLPF